MKKNIARILVVLLLAVMVPFHVYAANDDYIEVTIDGEFYDWEDKMDFHVPVYKNNAHGDEISQVCLFRDEANVYIHIIFPQSTNHNINSLQTYLETNLGDERYKLKLGQKVADGPEPFLIEEFELDAEEEPGEPRPEEPGEPQPEEPGFPQPEEPGEPQPEEPGEPQPEEPGEPQPEEPGEPQPEEPGFPQPEEPGEPQPEEGSDEQLSESSGEPQPEAPAESLEAAENPMIPEAYNETEEMIRNLFSVIDMETILTVADQEQEDLAETYRKPGGDFGKWEVAVNRNSSLVGIGYYVREQGRPDELEYSIPLSSINPDYEGIKEIEMRIPKLGDQTIMCTGASSGAFAGIAAGAGIAMLSVGAYGYQRRIKR